MILIFNITIGIYSCPYGWLGICKKKLYIYFTNLKYSDNNNNNNNVV